MASLALKGHVWELSAHVAADLIDQFFLKFVLNLIKLDVDRWRWLWAHNLVNHLIRDDQVVHLLTHGAEASLDRLLFELIRDDDGSFGVSPGADVSHSDGGAISPDHCCYRFHIFQINKLYLNIKY